MRARPLAVAETDLFVRQAERVWNDEERLSFIDYIARNPEAGDVIPETGGVRKIRWGRQGSGKRGGVRVIYFFHYVDVPLYLLMIYANDDLRKGTARRCLAGREARATGIRRKT
jgi:hypothetical protein